MELASMLANEPLSDRPASASAVIAAFLRTYNDAIHDERGRWRAWLGGRDSAAAVEETLAGVDSSPTRVG